jgi:hypothetical protein
MPGLLVWGVFLVALAGPLHGTITDRRPSSENEFVRVTGITASCFAHAPIGWSPDDDTVPAGAGLQRHQPNQIRGCLGLGVFERALLTPRDIAIATRFDVLVKMEYIRVRRRKEKKRGGTREGGSCMRAGRERYFDSLFGFLCFFFLSFFSWFFVFFFPAPPFSCET